MEKSDGLTDEGGERRSRATARSERPWPPKSRYPKLISLAVHELRTPASVVGGYLRMLQRDTEAPLSERQRKMVDGSGKVVRAPGRAHRRTERDRQARRRPDRAVREPASTCSRSIAEVAGSVHEAAIAVSAWRSAASATARRWHGDAAVCAAAFGAIFHAILREKPGPCTVVAERRLVRNDGQSSAVIVVAEEAERTGRIRCAGPERSTRSAAASACRCRSPGGSSRRTADGSGRRPSRDSGASRRDRRARPSAAVIAFP